MRTCYLHAGMIKTGSTAIQRAFRGYRDEDLVFAKLQSKNHILPFVAKFSRDPKSFHEFQKPGMTDERVRKDVKKYSRLIDKAASINSNIVFSSESFTHHLNPDELDEMISYLEARSERLRVLIYVRPLASLAASQMQQSIKHGLSKFRIPPPEYRKRIEPFIERVGRQNIELIRFDRNDLIGGNAISDFAARVGAKAVPELQEEEPNTSLSAEALGKLYAFNKHIGPHVALKWRRRARRSLISGLSKYGVRKFELPPRLIEEHIENHKSAVEWAENICGFDVRGAVKPAADPIESEADLLAAAGFQ